MSIFDYIYVLVELQVHISEARVSSALDKIAHMEELVNDRLLQDRKTTEDDQTSCSPCTSSQPVDVEKRKTPRRSLNVSGPVQAYHPHLKNFWYPVAFSNDLKSDTMVSQLWKWHHSFFYIIWSLYLCLNTSINTNEMGSYHARIVEDCLPSNN